MDSRPLIVIVGPTASGKTNLAIKLAKKFNGEIISADSRAIYKGMNIGTAKPTPNEQKKIKHWGIDLVEPDERFTVADFQKYANAKIEEIRARGKIPFLVGGSGLYIDSVIFDYEFNNDANPDLRVRLNKMTIEELQKYCKNNNILLPENHKNKRYLIRAIERENVVKNNRQKIRTDTHVVGITIDQDELKERIKIRTEQMFCDELYDEVKNLTTKYSFDLESMKSNIYPIIHRMLNGEISCDEAMILVQTDDWHLVKKQMTWFRRNPEIKWLELVHAENYLSEIITTGKTTRSST
ncbi:tRNA (adenosine(37)-N6)-dimethylallyltransferase MiaA [Candidatus Saccharibacteria bacterium]|nr:tRNA (adenosine(37)-N6)-dimethylallyltransferase MiaA [Candidatus Saccharibacteria bacterium]